MITNLASSIVAYRRSLSSHIRTIPNIPDEYRLDICVTIHFVERYFERFKYPYAVPFTRDFIQWINDNYCILLYEANVDATERRWMTVDLKYGRVVLCFFLGKINIKTCYMPTPEQIEEEKRKNDV